MKPLAIDLYCGLGGWAEGFLAEGYRVIGFDVEKHDYGFGTYPGELILRDILSISGAEIVMRFGVPRVFIASPPCQEPSLRNMPWGRLAMKRGKLGPPLKFIELFEACFRIRLEASVAAGSVIPLVIENVRGAQDWIGRAKGRYGSYYLWGDVPDKLPPTDRVKQHGSGAAWWDEALDKRRRDATALKTVGHLNKRDGHSHTRHLTNQREHLKVPGIKLSEVGFNVAAARRIEESHKLAGSRISAEERKRMRTQHIGTSRKAASALIAKIPFTLAQHIARCFKPEAA